MKEAKFELYKNQSKTQPFGTRLRGLNGKIVGAAETFGTKQNAWKNILAFGVALRTPGILVHDLSMPDGYIVEWIVSYDETSKKATKTLIEYESEVESNPEIQA